MIMLRCPYCGELRTELEITCGGELGVARPADPQVATDVAWTEYLYFRSNPKGLLREQWCCSYGCGQWFKVERHTVTHEITRVLRFDRPFTEAGAI